MKKYFKILCVAFLLVLLTGCALFEIPFGQLHKLEFQKESDTLVVPGYCFSVDSNRKPTEQAGVQFIQNDVEFTFSDFEVKETNEPGMVLASFKTHAKTTLEYYSSVSTKWYYAFSQLAPFVFDYYTGEVYNYSVTNTGGYIFTNRLGVDPTDNNSTTITFRGKDNTVEASQQLKYTGWKSKNCSERDSQGRWHCTVPVETDTITSVLIPRGYDGVVIGLSKKGITKEDVQKEYDRKQKAASSKDTKTDVKEGKVEKVENYKLIDSSRNDASIDDYYYIRFSDVMPTYGEDEEAAASVEDEKAANMLRLLILLGVVMGVVILITIIIIIIVVSKSSKKKQAPAFVQTPVVPKTTPVTVPVTVPETVPVTVPETEPETTPIPEEVKEEVVEEKVEEVKEEKKPAKKTTAKKTTAKKTTTKKPAAKKTTAKKTTTKKTTAKKTTAKKEK